MPSPTSQQTASCRTAASAGAAWRFMKQSLTKPRCHVSKNRSADHMAHFVTVPPACLPPTATQANYHANAPPSATCIIMKLKAARGW
ncbi:hypothetical protein IF1G_08872 [Cordyceps javanica]|uniref:Uncharacterized protein n=1 Tax=Cordyceps javanica TaxID=43265 RepID=A0A545USB1_9HYPO|nr:hypothetical protein IF1G_08872 [Cordyceps javanica]